MKNLTQRRKGAKPLTVGVLMIVGDPLDPFFERFPTKVHQQSKRKVEQAQIRQHLLAMERR
ncbi:MAG: hypothetical protein RLZZ58_441 [Pseudomonadota bacterium]